MESVTLLAGCVVTNAAGQILLLHRNTPHRSQWETPGGKIGGSEPVAAAARRRAEEEIGTVLRLSRIVGSCQFTSDHIRYNYLWFQASISHGSVTVLSRHKHDAWRFFSWAELTEIREQLSGNVRILYQRHQLGKIRILPHSGVAGGGLNSGLAVPVVAGCVIHDEEGRVLLLRRIRADGDQWETPGGKVHLGESPEECAQRELREELDVTVDVGGCIAMKELDHFGKQIVYAWFHATIVSGTPRLMERHIHDALAYLSWDELERAEPGSLSTSVRALLEIRRENVGGGDATATGL